MIDQEIIERVKREVSIVSYLQRLGHEPVSTGKQFVYRSPLSGERTASFFVDVQKNVFNDFSSDERGDVIRLVRLLHRFSFVQAIDALQAQGQTPFFFLSGQKSEPIPESKLEILAITPLKHLALLEYLNRRAIPTFLADQYTKEVHFLSKGQKRFGIGFSANNGSWAIRSDKFKCWIGSGDFSFYEGFNSTALNLFEGFFDFLSCMVHFRVNQLKNDSLILNSTTHLGKAMETIQRYQLVNCFLDTDKTGRKTYQKLLDNGVSVVDQSAIYEGHTDFNEWLINRSYIQAQK